MYSTVWDKEDSALAGQSLVSTMESVIDDQQNHYNNLIYYASLYKDKSYFNWLPGGQEDTIDRLLDTTPVTYNVIRMCVDTLQSKVSLHQPSPKVLTSQGSETLQESAKDMEKFILGVIYENDLYEVAKKALRDACLYGMGVLKVYEENNRVKVCIVNPYKIVVDNKACLTADPLFIGHYEYIERNTLLELYKDKSDIIEQASAVEKTGGTHPRDLIKVYEGYRKKVGSDKGRHIIAISSGSLIDDEYMEEDFPYVVIRFQDDLMGWFGIGIAEMLSGIQAEINKTTTKFQTNMNLLSVPYLLKHRSSEVHDEQLLSNEEARLVEWSGNIKPELVVPNAISSQEFEYLENLFSKAFEIAGISQLSVTSQKQPGLNSGVAIRTHLDVETQRFSLISKRWERLFIDISKQIIKLAQRISERDEAGYKIQYPDKQFIGEINFNDVNLQENQFVLQISAASALPLSPAGKLERVVEMVNAQMISPDEGRKMLDFPDLDKFNRLATADVDDLERLFESFIKGGKYIEPLIYQNLQLGIKLGTSYYLRANLDGVSESKLNNILRWLQEASDMLAPPQAPQAPPPAVEMNLPTSMSFTPPPSLPTA
jgi:hypothetical protein